MDDVEHAVATAGFAIRDRSEALRSAAGEIRKADQELGDELIGTVALLNMVGRELERIATTWHYIERRQPHQADTT